MPDMGLDSEVTKESPSGPCLVEGSIRSLQSECVKPAGPPGSLGGLLSVEGSPTSRCRLFSFPVQCLLHPQTHMVLW